MVTRRYAATFGFDDPATLADEPWSRRFAGGSRARVDREAVPRCREVGHWCGTVTGRDVEGEPLELELSLATVGDDRLACSVRPADTGVGSGRIGNGSGRSGDGRRSIDTHVADLALEIARESGTVETRRELEALVCGALVASGPYEAVWIVGPHGRGDRPRPRTVAGQTPIRRREGEPGEVESGAGDPGVAGPDPLDIAGRARRSGGVAVGGDAGLCLGEDDDGGTATGRRTAAAAVPLVHRGTARGVLVLFAARPGAFDPAERTSLLDFGRVVGLAVDALESHRLLYADAVTELEFEVVDDGLPFVSVSDRLSCRLAISGCVAAGPGRWSVYVAVEGADPAAVRAAARDAPAVETARVLATADGGGTLEFVVAGPAFAELAARGGTLVAGHAEDGQGRFRLEVPVDADVRSLSGRLRAAYPDSTLVAKREVDREARTAAELRSCVTGRLTDRQREALERAVRAGYFEWPRDCTGTDVADSMDVAETTFHYHLRNGLATLLEAFVDPADR